MEQKYESITKRILHLNTLLTRSVSESKKDTGSLLFSRETLIDALILLYDECNNEFLMKDPLITDFVEKYRSTILKLRDLNVGIGDFEVKKVISRGRFAEVVVAKEKTSQNVCVLKKIRKSDILNVSESIYFENERNLLIAALCDKEARKWVPQLFYAFQNMKYLYYVLEFCPGGNLCTMLEYYKKNVPEPMLRFYLAEMIQAIHAVHLIGFAHRDIRPENVLVDKTGHLKLVDFGSSAKLSRHGQINSKMVFNIPHYTAPEIFKFHESPSSKGYTAMCDWWSLGIVLYELMYGSVPFTSDDIPKLHLSISNYRRKLQYPTQVNASQDLKNIICGLLQPVEKRFGYEKLINLDYFNDIAWACLRDRDPPFVPSLTAPDDTSYFITFEVQRPTPKVEDYKLQRRFTGRNLPFLGFTYLGSDSANFDDNSSSASSYVVSHFPASICERRKTENYPTCKEIEYNTEITRFSTGTFRDRQMHSECSDESYQSASVRLQNEVNQLHLFYNEKALVIERKLKNKFHQVQKEIVQLQDKLNQEQKRKHEEIAELQAKLNKELERKQNEIVELNGKLSQEEKQKQNEIGELKDKLEKKLDQKASEISHLQEKLNQEQKLKQAEIARLQDELNKELNSKQKQISDIEGKLAAMNDDLFNNLVTIEDLKTALEKKNKSIEKCKDEISSLKKQLEEKCEELNTFRTNLCKSNEEKGKLESKIEALLKEIKKENLAVQHKAELEKIQELQATVEGLHKSLDSKEETIKEKEIKLQARITRIISLKEELQKVKNENNDVKKEMNKLENNMKEKENEINQLKSEISKMKDEITRNESAYNSSKEEIENWKTKYENLKKDSESVRETCLMLDKAVEGYENHIEKMKEEFKEKSEKNTELRNEIDRLTDKLKSAKKMVNEEKSLKIFAENKIRLLECDLEKRNEELKTLKENEKLKVEQIANLEGQIRQLEEFIVATKESIAKNSEYMNLLENEMMALKKDRSDYLTEIYELKKEKKELINELDETRAEANDLRKVNSELVSVLAQNEAYHEINHLKGNMTVQQLSKLVDFLLQNNCQDSTKQKRTLADKLFRSKGKENLNPKELENLLYAERAKCKDLTDQLYRARIELSMLKGEYSSKLSSPSAKTNSDFESNLSRTTSNTKQLTSISNFSELEMPSSRIKHNIPHKFETKKCTKTGCRCSVCNNVISFGHTVSYCKECHTSCHVSCMRRSEPNCGLPKALIEQMAVLNKCPIQATSSESSLKSEIEGNIRVLRDGKWEKMHICIESKNLLLYNHASTGEQCSMKIPFNSIKNIADEVDGTSILTLSSSYNGEANCELKIIYEDEQSQKSLYMRTSAEDDKVNWLNVLKRNITLKQTFKLEPQECFKGSVVCSFNRSDRLKVNQMLQISPEVCLIAADQGLYSLKLNVESENTSSCKPVKLSGVEKVSKIRILTKLRIAVLISGEENLLKKCGLRMLKTNAEAAECSSPFVTLDDASPGISLRNCELLETSRCNSLISFSTDKHLMILEWKDCGFDVLKFKKKISQIRWLLFTPLNMFYSTNNEFCRIELQNMNENRINVFKCKEETNSKSCRIEDMIKINSDLYLVCDKSSGIFVDANGKRIKSAETMKWPLPLKRIVYNKPFLYIVHEYSVSLVCLPSTNEYSEEKFKFSMIDFINPAVLGVVKQPTRGVYIKEEDEDRCDVFFLNPLIFKQKNPKQSWSSISTHSGQTTDEECIEKCLNISSETDISLNSSILESSSDH